MFSVKNEQRTECGASLSLSGEAYVEGT